MLDMDIPEQPQGVRLIAPFLVGAGKGQGVLGTLEGVLKTTSPQTS